MGHHLAISMTDWDVLFPRESCSSHRPRRPIRENRDLQKAECQLSVITYQIKSWFGIFVHHRPWVVRWVPEKEFATSRLVITNIIISLCFMWLRQLEQVFLGTSLTKRVYHGGLVYWGRICPSWCKKITCFANDKLLFTKYRETIYTKYIDTFKVMISNDMNFKVCTTNVTIIIRQDKPWSAHYANVLVP